MITFQWVSLSLSMTRIIREVFGNWRRLRVSSLELMAMFEVHSSEYTRVANALFFSRDQVKDYPLEVRASEEIPSSNPCIDADMLTTLRLIWLP